MLKLTVAIARKLDCSASFESETEALMKEIHQEEVLEHIQQRRKDATASQQGDDPPPPQQS